MTFWQITLDLLHGFGLTCLLFLLTLILALPLGLGLSFCTMSKWKPVKVISRVFVWVIRGIPLMLFICMIYYLPGLLGSGSMNVLTGSTDILRSLRAAASFCITAASARCSSRLSSTMPAIFRRFFEAGSRAFRMVNTRRDRFSV